MDGYHLEQDAHSSRKTCLKDCEIKGCQKCKEAFYSACKVCYFGYALADDGLCSKVHFPEDEEVAGLTSTEGAEIATDI